MLFDIMYTLLVSVKFRSKVSISALRPIYLKNGSFFSQPKYTLGIDISVCKIFLGDGRGFGNHVLTNVVN